jgi:hypothetical protein
MTTTEKSSDPLLTEALWWFQRWVSGSMGDPDWEEDWLQQVRDPEAAFRILNRTLGNARAAKTVRKNTSFVSLNDVRASRRRSWLVGCVHR